MVYLVGLLFKEQLYLLLIKIIYNRIEHLMCIEIRIFTRPCDGSQ